MRRDGKKHPIAARDGSGGRFTWRDVVLAVILVPALLLLILPLLPYPGDHATMMRIWFRDAGQRVAHMLSLPMDESECSEVALAMAARDPATGTYTRVVCGKGRIHAERRNLIHPGRPGAT
ncbi:MAG: hypothetical protein ACREFD_02015 [Stellaceae bacterium]